MAPEISPTQVREAIKVLLQLSLMYERPGYGNFAFTDNLSDLDLDDALVEKKTRETLLKYLDKPVDRLLKFKNKVAQLQKQGHDYKMLVEIIIDNYRELAATAYPPSIPKSELQKELSQAVKRQSQAAKRGEKTQVQQQLVNDLVEQLKQHQIADRTEDEIRDELLYGIKPALAQYEPDAFSNEVAEALLPTSEDIGRGNLTDIRESVLENVARVIGAALDIRLSPSTLKNRQRQRFRRRLPIVDNDTETQKDLLEYTLEIFGLSERQVSAAIEAIRDNYDPADCLMEETDDFGMEI